MRTSYFRRRSAFFSSRGRLVAFIAGLLLVVVLLIRFAFPSVFFALAAPVFALGNAIDAASVTSEELQARADQALMNENDALRARIEDLERLLGERASAPEGIIAGVIARPPMAPYDSLIVAAGSKDGVASGMLVSADGGIPVGSIENVAERHAQVSLFSTAGRATEGWAGEARLPLTLIGKGAGAFTAEVPRDAELSEGALVFVPGPGARPIGRIVRIDADPSSPSAMVRIEPLANIFSLPVVLIEPLP